MKFLLRVQSELKTGFSKIISKLTHSILCSWSSAPQFLWQSDPTLASPLSPSRICPCPLLALGWPQRNLLWIGIFGNNQPDFAKAASRRVVSYLLLWCETPLLVSTQPPACATFGSHLKCSIVVFNNWNILPVSSKFSIRRLWSWPFSWLNWSP